MSARAAARGAGAQIPEPNITRFLFADTRLSPLWLVVRLYLGVTWLLAGWGKLTDPEGVWVGANSGAALGGFVQGALEQTGGESPDVSGWYAALLENAVLPNAAAFSYVVVFGQLAVGLGLIVGLLTGIAAFFGLVMNANFLLAGTVSTNPEMLILAALVMLAWRSAGHLGLDRWALPRIGVPGAAGSLFRRPKNEPGEEPGTA